MNVPNHVKGQSALDQVRDGLVPHKEYMYRVFEDFELGARDLTQSLFTGSLWRSVRATETCFRRSDFDGMQLENCVFQKADLWNADIRSTSFVNCRFTECRFDDALIDSCSFDKCSFDKCSFGSAAVKHSFFAECRFAALTLAKSSFTMCRIEDSTLSDAELADCTFLYVILWHCALTRVSANIESLGTVFGIAKEDLARITFVHLGVDAVPVFPDDLPGALARTYEAHRWALPLAISRINFGLTATAYAISEYLSEIGHLIASGRRAPREELIFLVDVFEVLRERDRLPLVCLIQLGELLHAMPETLETHRAGQRLTQSTMSALAARIGSLTKAAIDHLAGALIGLELNDHSPLLVECHYDHKPATDLAVLVSEATNTADLNNGPMPRRVATRCGSYIEVLQLTIGSAFALQVLLYAINGILIQLIEMKERVRVLKSKRSPKEFQLIARSEHQSIPAALRHPLRKLLDFAGAGSWIKQPDLGGLDERNLRHVALGSDSTATTEKRDVVQ